ncbi:hypothetical protein [Pseudoteredinibacter isoporae]|uniref:hypothetical protein n=1 Tax=Pseudoteredinibacter isoporae TaxID=570281 RepID=UPI003106F0FE
MSRKLDISAVVSLIKDFDSEMLSDEDWDRLKEVDPSQEAQILEMFQEFIVSGYEAMDSKSKSLIKDSLYGVLSSPEFDYSSILDSVEMPFESIENPRSFFLLLWFAIFREQFTG